MRPDPVLCVLLALWDWLEQEYAAGSLRSIRQVGTELSAGGDELATWADGLEDAFFPVPDAAVLAAAQQVSCWVVQQGYESAAVNTFLQVADY